MRIFKSAIEVIPAVLLLLMAFLTTVSVITRYAINTPVPDEYEISRLLLSVVVCWGIAAAFQKDEHIYLDIFWRGFSENIRALLSRVGSVISFFIVSGYSFALFTKVLDTMRSGILTIDLGITVWGFQFSAWLGTVAAALVLARQVLWPEKPEHQQESYL